MNILKYELDDTILKLKRFRDSIPDDDREIGTHPNDYNPLYFHHGDWDCKDSPTKNCMYTVDFDCCIFCGEPDERK
jgi:hypothetical protein